MSWAIFRQPKNSQFAEEFDEDEWRPLLDAELEAIAGAPFETAIRHVLQFARIT